MLALLYNLSCFGFIALAGYFADINKPGMSVSMTVISIGMGCWLMLCYITQTDLMGKKRN